MTAAVWADLIALGALFLSGLALVLSYFTRKKDRSQAEKADIRVRERAEAADIRARVWAIMSTEPGVRTVLALDDYKDKTIEPDKRLKLLKRTADVLRAAGASDVGKSLDGVLDQKWSDPPSPEALKRRSAFIDSMTEFMTPT
jgi:hypothetical protein